jgi:flagellar FliJ protein
MAKNALKLVHEQREKQVMQALQAYQKAQRILFEQRQQIQNLQQYRQQYINQLQQKGAEGVSIAALSKYQQFIVQIDAGMAQHQSGLVKYEYDVQAHKKMWLESQVKCKAIAILLGKKVKQAQLAEDRKEQKLFDEFSIFQHFQKSART